MSINDYEPDNALALIESGHVDTVQVIYNAFHQAPRERLLPACAEHDTVRVALPDAGLTGRITADSTFPEGDCSAPHSSAATARPRSSGG